MKMKRLVSTLLTGVMALSLVACGSSSAPATSGDGGSATTEIKSENVAKSSGDSVVSSSDDAITLNMWCIATESDSNRHSYEAAIADMQEKYPNITFN